MRPQVEVVLRVNAWESGNNVDGPRGGDDDVLVLVVAVLRL